MSRSNVPYGLPATSFIKHKIALIPDHTRNIHINSFNYWINSGRRIIFENIVLKSSYLRLFEVTWKKKFNPLANFLANKKALKV
jgi:hypothetical protein